MFILNFLKFCQQKLQHCCHEGSKVFYSFIINDLFYVLYILLIRSSGLDEHFTIIISLCLILEGNIFLQPIRFNWIIIQLFLLMKGLLCRGSHRVQSDVWGQDKADAPRSLYDAGRWLAELRSYVTSTLPQLSSKRSRKLT